MHSLLVSVCLACAVVSATAAPSAAPQDPSGPMSTSAPAPAPTTSAPAASNATTPGPVFKPTDTFIDLVDSLEQMPFFATLPQLYKVLTFEMLTAAETGNLRGLMDRIEIITLLKFITLLPKDVSDGFIQYAIDHLENEGAPNHSSLP